MTTIINESQTIKSIKTTVCELGIGIPALQFLNKTEKIHKLQLEKRFDINPIK